MGRGRRRGTQGGVEDTGQGDRSQSPPTVRRVSRARHIASPELDLLPGMKAGVRPLLFLDPLLTA